MIICCNTSCAMHSAKLSFIKGLFGYELSERFLLSMTDVHRLGDCVPVSDGSLCRARKMPGGIA